MRLDSTVKKFPGYVTLPDFLNILQVRAFEDAFFGDLNEVAADPDKKVFVSVNDEKMLPVILQIATEWHLEGVPEKPTAETFPATPRKAAHELITGISNAIYELWRGEEVPND